MGRKRSSRAAAGGKPGSTGCGAAVLGIVSLGALLLGLSMLRTALRPFVSYEETTCTIVSKRLDSHLSTSKTKSGSSRTTTMYTPKITFTYSAGGRTYTTTGYQAMEISGGSRDAEQAVLDSFEIGSNYPCWYDPDQPSEAVLARFSFSALVFGVFPIIVALFCGVGAAALSGVGLGGLLGIGALPKRRRARRDALAADAAGGGKVVLRSRARSGRELLFLAGFALVWNGMMALFLTLMITRTPKDVPWLVYGILGLFTLIGIGLLAGVAKQALRLLGAKRPGLALDSDHLAPGGKLRGRLLLRGPQEPSALELRLVATETVTTTRRRRKSTHTTVRTETRHDQSILTLEPGRILAAETAKHEFEAQLPPSLATPEWSWCLSLRTVQAGESEPVVHEFPLDALIEG